MWTRLMTRVKDKRDSVKGAIVYTPPYGVFENVVILDFGRFYPSIMLAHRLSKELMKFPLEQRLNMDLGLIPRGITKVFKERDKYEMILKEMLEKEGPEGKAYKSAERQRTVTKFRANAYYGVQLFGDFRFRDEESMIFMLGEAREFLDHIKTEAQKMGFRLLYGDTDSIMIVCRIDQVKEVENLVQKTIKTLCIEKGIDPSLIKINAERFASKAVFLKKKGDKVGAKKKYIMRIIREYKDGLVIKCDYHYIKGIDAIRGNTSNISKNMQVDFINAIFQDNVEVVMQKIRDLISDINNDKVDVDDYAISMNLSRDTSEYKSNTEYVRGTKYANSVLKLGIRKGDRIKMIFIKRIPGKPRTDVLCYHDKRDLPKNIMIDKEKTIKRTITMKIEQYLEVSGYSIGDLKNVKDVSIFL